MSQHNPYNANNMIPGGYNGAANANPAAAAANHYGAANHHPQVEHNSLAGMHAAAAAGRIAKFSFHLSLAILYSRCFSVACNFSQTNNAEIQANAVPLHLKTCVKCQTASFLSCFTYLHESSLFTLRLRI